MATIFKNVANNVAGSLKVAITAAQTSLTVGTGEGSNFPAAPFYASVDYEVVLVTAKASDLFTITRGQNGTNAAVHSLGALLEMRDVAALWTDAYAAINTAENEIDALQAAIISVDAATLDGKDNLRFSQLIAELSGAAASYDFQSVPQTFRNLRCTYSLRGDTAAAGTALLLRINNDAGAVYYAQRVGGQVAAAFAVEQLGTTSMLPGTIPAATATSGLFGVGQFIFPNYTGSSNKKGFVGYSADFRGTASGDFLVYTVSGVYTSIDALSRITLIPTAGNFAANSICSLYGDPT